MLQSASDRTGRSQPSTAQGGFIAVPPMSAGGIPRYIHGCSSREHDVVRVAHLADVGAVEDVAAAGTGKGLVRVGGSLASPRHLADLRVGNIWATIWRRVMYFRAVLSLRGFSFDVRASWPVRCSPVRRLSRPDLFTAGRRSAETASMISACPGDGLRRFLVLLRARAIRASTSSAASADFAAARGIKEAHRRSRRRL